MPSKKKLKKRLKAARRECGARWDMIKAYMDALDSAVAFVQDARAFARELNADFGERRMAEWKEKFLRETEGYGALKP
jgi:hypothetical protein